jgi:hypothetical protein
MVRNTKGGKGAKSMARKSFASGASGLPVPTCELEQFAVVSKIYGPSCDVLLLDGTSLLCHIRNKFKGRHKSGNLITVGSIILIGYREWEPDTARKNCDLLFVYDSVQSASLAERFSLPAIDSHTSLSSGLDILFDNSDTGHSNTITSTITSTIPSLSHSDFQDL